MEIARVCFIKNSIPIAKPVLISHLAIIQINHVILAEPLPVLLPNRHARLPQMHIYDLIAVGGDDRFWNLIVLYHH